MQRILTVSAPASSADLVTLADVKLELGITSVADDAWLASVITRASSAAAVYCCRDFVVQTYSEQVFPDTEPFPWQVPDDFSVLQLSRWPIVGAVTVTELGATAALVQDTDFLIVADVGQILRRDEDGKLSTWCSTPLIVEYQAGYAIIPADLQDAVLEIVKGRWYARRRDPQLRQEQIDGVYSATYWFGTGPGGPADMPDYIAAKLDRYRVPVIA
jgi:hypothetical protein